MAKLSEQVAALEARLNDAEQDACDSRLYRDVLDAFGIPYGHVAEFIRDLQSKLAAAEKERDALRESLDSACKQLLSGSHRLTSALEGKEAAESALAEAEQGRDYWFKVAESHAQDALTRAAKMLEASGQEVAADLVSRFKRTEYPAAPTEREGTPYVCPQNIHGSFCDSRCTMRNTEALTRPATPPQAAPEPLKHSRVPTPVAFAGGYVWRNESDGWNWERNVAPERRKGLTSLTNWEFLPLIAELASSKSVETPTASEYAALLALAAGGK